MMKIDKRLQYAILTIILLAIVVAASVMVIGTGDHEKQKTFNGEIVGLNSYGDPVFDITADNIISAGYSEGDMFDIEMTGKTIYRATLTHGYLGVFMFDTYLNTEKDGRLAAGSYWGMTFSKEIGSKVTIRYCGHNDSYSKLDKCLVNYSNSLEDYGGDEEVFANFYMVSGGDITEGKLYRSFNPYSVSTRSPYVNKFAEENGINYTVTLSMTSEKIEGEITKGSSGYCIDLFKEGNNTAYDITYKYFLQKETLNAILTDMSENDGPYLVHCNVGRDRTGFMTTLLQALCGADETDMAESAAQAYVNLYGVVKGSEEYRVVESCTYSRNIFYICNYDKIPTDLVDDNLPLNMEGKTVEGIDIQKAAYTFCTEYLGMDGSVVDHLIDNLCS